MAKKEKVQKDKQQSAKHTYKTKDRATWTPLKTEVLSILWEIMTRVEWGWVNHVSKGFNFVSKLCGWIQMLFKNVKACLKAK